MPEEVFEDPFNDLSGAFFLTKMLFGSKMYFNHCIIVVYTLL